MAQNYRDSIIIGAGPAGLQLGYFLKKAGRDYLILEADRVPGSFFKRYPRHRTLLSINKVRTGIDDPEMNLRYDWNSLLCDSDAMRFKHFSRRYFPAADDLVRYLAAFADHYDLNIQYGTRVGRVSAHDGTFRVETASGDRYACRKLIVATGVGKAYVPAIPGIEHAEFYQDMTIDPEDFDNQRVLIIGKGNSAFETADNLIETTASIHLTSPKPLRLAWKSHYVGHLRAVNNNTLDTYLLKSQNGLLEAHIRKIERLDNGKLRVGFDLTRAHGSRVTYDYDRVLACTGFRFDTELFDNGCRPDLALDDRFPAMTSSWESVNVPKLFFAGTLMQTRDFHKTQSSFIHGFRYNIRALHRMFELRFGERPWPSRALAFTPDDVCARLIDRMNRGTALWHQPGFLCDLLVVDDAGQSGVYHEELPVDFVRDGGLGRLPDYLMLTLEYGPDSPEFPFEFNRFVDEHHAHLNPQLHPVIRRFQNGSLVSEHHVLEEIEGRWRKEIFIKPLRSYLRYA